MEKLRRYIEEITPLNDAEFENVKAFFFLKKTRKSQYLIHEGDEVNHEYLVTSGIYKAFYLDNQGKEYIVQFAQEGKWMSDYHAFFKRTSASMYIECIEAGEVLCLTLHGREKLSAELHKMEYFFRSRLTNGYVDMEQRVRLLLSNSPKERYEEFAKSHPGLMQRLPKKSIAMYLGTCRETLSRLYVGSR